MINYLEYLMLIILIQLLCQQVDIKKHIFILIMVNNIIIMHFLCKQKFIFKILILIH